MHWDRTACNSLSTMTTLKTKSEIHSFNKKKIKKLKKRNAELAAIARRLEEKAKQLQQDNKVVTRH